MEPGERDPAAMLDGIRVLVRLSRLAQQECERTGLSLPQYRALVFNSKGTRRAAELASFAQVSRPAVTALANGLVELGLMRRESVPGDGRGVRFVLTRKGRQAMQHAEERMIERFSKLLGPRDDLWNMVCAIATLEEALDTELEQELEADEIISGSSSGPPRAPARRGSRSRAKGKPVRQRR